jgi:putative tricarboxylic transport membrane protein
MPPGPRLITSHPNLFWGVISSMYIGNIMLLVLNLPLIGVWVKILKVPYPVLFPLILLFCLIGAYSLNNNPAEIGLMLIFGILGYLMKKFKYDGAPLVLAMVLGPLMDNSLRQSLLMSGGSGMIFFTRPICLIILGMVAVIFLLPVLPHISRMRKTVGEAD